MESRFSFQVIILNLSVKFSASFFFCIWVSPCLVKPFTRDHIEDLVGGTVGVVKWRGVGVYLLGTSVWQGQVFLRKRREELDQTCCRCISDWLLAYRLKTPTAKTMYCTIDTRLWLANVTYAISKMKLIIFSAPSCIKSCLKAHFEVKFHQLVLCPIVEEEVAILRRAGKRKKPSVILFLSICSAFFASEM
jgi:hypothetical protein